MTTLTIPGHVTLDTLDTPAGLVGWTGLLPFGSSEATRDASRDGIDVSVLIGEDDDVAGLDLPFMASVLADLDGVLQLAAGAVRSAVAEDPARFGAEEEAEFGLDGPELTFGLGHAWTLRFADCTLPGTVELGVAVYFEGTTPVEVDELADVEDDVVDHD
ncbi:hypothetical protein HQQ80_07630 [Microbacteriaceae bacterium VKM Ac-2855]|nr:hypothetical protein [Microbacteriaceae bacterium VKM Ac-2855]